MGFGDTRRCKSAHGYDRRALRPTTGGQRVVPRRLVLDRAGGTQVQIPAGKSLFSRSSIPRMAHLNDPPATRTEEFVRAAASCTEARRFGIHRRLQSSAADSVLYRRFGQLSPLFNVQLPPLNLFGVDESIVPEPVLSPSGEQGYYLFVRPLAPGDHVFGGSHRDVYRD